MVKAVEKVKKLGSLRESKQPIELIVKLRGIDLKASGNSIYKVIRFLL